MKKIVLFVFVALTATAFAQKSFEGVIKYDIQIDGDNADVLKGFLPNSYVFYISNNDLRVKINGGLMANYMNDMLYISEKETTYSLNADQKTAYRFTDKTQDTADSIMEISEKEVTKTNETETILNYECTKYKVAQTVNGTEVVEYVWITDKIKTVKNNLDSPAMQNIGIKGVDGTALKSCSTVQQNDIKFNMTIIAVSVDEKPLEKTLFQLPDEYEVKEFTRNNLGF